MTKKPNTKSQNNTLSGIGFLTLLIFEMAFGPILILLLAAWAAACFFVCDWLHIKDFGWQIFIAMLPFVPVVYWKAKQQQLGNPVSKKADKE